MFKTFIIATLLLSLAFCGGSSNNTTPGSDLVYKQIPTEQIQTDAHLLELFDFGVDHVLQKILNNSGVTNLDFEADVWWIGEADGNYNANHYTQFATVVNNNHGITFNITFVVREYEKGGKDVFSYKYKGWYDDAVSEEIKECRESEDCGALGEIELDVEVISEGEAEEICEEAQEEESSGNNGGTEVEIPEEECEEEEEHHHEEEECEEEEEESTGGNEEIEVELPEEECEEEEHHHEEEECEEEEHHHEEEEECEEEEVEEEESGNNGGTEVEIPEEECEVEIEVEVEECEEEEENGPY